MPIVIAEVWFQEVLQDKLGDLWEQALEIFRRYGPDYSSDVTNALHDAVEKDRAAEVLAILQDGLRDLSYRRLEIGQIVASLGCTSTEAMFIHIRHGVLNS